MTRSVLPALSLLLLAPAAALGATSPELIQARNGSGYFGYKDTPKLPWCDWLVHDPDRPAPPRVDPGPAGPSVVPPADAVVLFSGRDASAWRSPNDWKAEGGHLVSGNVKLSSREEFGDIQLHLEWQSPANFPGPWSDQGNNGVFLMGLYEIQVFDSHSVKIYPDGACGAVYGQTPPRVEAARPAGQWQSYDIIFTAPRFEGERLVTPARVTVFLNGVLVQHETEIRGETGHRRLPAYTQKRGTGPVTLGGHGCPVRFRNIWVRRL
ncbi:MAG: hypothetical protein RIR76_639 [Verrucomicrobiota bacterium]|jgi:hypothetical protein|nr:DUF1080 domain-containing protein [Opitutaceae bacterium]